MTNSATRLSRRAASSRGPAPIARVALLIRSHALPPLSYRVPDRLAGSIRVGTAVVAPLSGYGRLGIVVGFERREESGEDRALKELRATAPDLTLPASLVGLCVRVASEWVLPPQAVLRAALPPGTTAAACEVVWPAPDWPWRRGEIVDRSGLRRALGAAGLRAAEEEMRVVLSPKRARRRTAEWAVLREEGMGSHLPQQAHRQRALIEALERSGGARPVSPLLEEAGAGRASLRQLVRRGFVRLEKRPEAAPVSYSRGSGAGLGPYEAGAGRALERGGPWIWRMPASEDRAAVAAVARAAAARGGGTLVLAPEVEAVERMVRELRRLLPAGLALAPYHAGLGRGRESFYEAARRGEVDVLVGTRAAALVPFSNLRAICVVDEPNEAHRADPEGHEGVPVHVRDLALERGRTQGVPAVFLSPTPSLRLYAPESGASRLPPRKPRRWPAIRLVDLRGTGAVLSSTLLDACRDTLREGGRVGVVANRLGLATLVSCRRCGHVLSCPACRRPFALHDGPQGRSLVCGACGRREGMAPGCPACGSDRLGGAGLAAGRVRAALADALGVEVGLLTADAREALEARVVVGTARPVSKEEWDLVAVPDADALLLGAGRIETGFRLLYRSAETSRSRLLAQTRSPEHPVLRAALAGDYESFAAAELERRRVLGYPPHGHHASITLTGPESEVRHAVKSRLRPVLEPSIELTGPSPVPANGAGDDAGAAWRLLLKGRRRDRVAAAAKDLVAGMVEGKRGGMRARVEMDPEEV